MDDGRDGSVYMLKLRHTGTPNVGGGEGAMWGKDVSYTLSTSQDQTMFVPVDFRHFDCGEPNDAAGTINAKSTGGYSLNYQPGVLDTSEYVVRRLTPEECERLQGFPTGWTSLVGCDVDAVTEMVAASLNYSDEEREKLRRKIAKWAISDVDGPRYKACGNSMAVPVMRWIGERIQMVEDDLSRKEEIDGKPTE